MLSGESSSTVIRLLFFLEVNLLKLFPNPYVNGATQSAEAARRDNVLVDL